VDAMMLSKVEYEFFDFEEPSSTAQTLSRQLRLHFVDAPALYVWWTSERQHGPDSQPSSIAYAESSYFLDRAASVIDASSSLLWARHVGRELDLAYASASSGDLECQVLEIRSGTGRTYVSSLGVDRIGISDTSPA
jgi:hypothetical protein